MSDLLQYLQSQKTSSVGVPIKDVSCLLDGRPDNISVTELNELVKFASNQVGIWESEWMFSPSESPHLTAKEESEHWSKLWETWFETLSELIPDMKEQSERLHSLSVIQYQLSKSVDYNKGRPLIKLISVSTAQIAITLNKLGIRGLAQHLYKLALYPKGTVGRTI
ncbi:MAG: hypothetical protein JJE30_09850 [Desulfuromonadales bacterium]|nr:hypothetical protein [Desulfuromonadales bacterium]